MGMVGASRVNILMCIRKETFTFKRGARCMFKGRGVITYAFDKEYSLEDCLDEYCIVKGWEWITLIKTAVKDGSEWGYFTYKVTCQDIGQGGWGLD